MPLSPTGAASLHGLANATAHEPRRALSDRLQQAVQDETKLPVPDPQEAVDRFVRNLYANQFMQAMLFEDEEKTGVKAEPWD